MRLLAALTALALTLAAGPSGAQGREQTLADIRQEMSVLFVELQRLKRELVTTGSPSVAVAGRDLLERVDLIEAELTRLTDKTEELEYRIDQIVLDGTNRLGDLEFRLCELEAGCDVATLGQTSTLGGGALPVAPTSPPAQSAQTDAGGAQLAVGEQADFDAAKAALDAGDFAVAAERFLAFTESYTGGPLTGEAHYWRGVALEEMGDMAGAARAFLNSFSGSPEGARAPDALYSLGLALDALGQAEEACLMLAEVGKRYPAAGIAQDARTARADLGCS